VGALKPDNYRAYSSWIDATPIDLRSRHPSIVEQDFLLLDETENHEKWDSISLSLVLNFVPDARERGIPQQRFKLLKNRVFNGLSGRMLRMAHSILSPNGYLFLVVSVNQ
jgi:25S rRNA (adenine2142-N1)-methyltransferase